MALTALVRLAQQLTITLCKSIALLLYKAAAEFWLSGGFCVLGGGALALVFFAGFPHRFPPSSRRPNLAALDLGPGEGYERGTKCESSDRRAKWT